MVDILSLILILLYFENIYAAIVERNGTYYFDTKKPKACDPAPFLYVTFHDKYQNIFKYSRNGCLLQTDVLSDGPILSKHRYTELRLPSVWLPDPDTQSRINF